MAILSDILQHMQDEIGNLYPEKEFRNIRRIVFERLTDIHPVDFHIKPNLEVSDDIFAKIKEIVAELKTFRPIQYVLGITEFMGLKLKVTPSVLIQGPKLKKWPIG